MSRPIRHLRSLAHPRSLAASARAAHGARALTPATRQCPKPAAVRQGRDAPAAPSGSGSSTSSISRPSSRSTPRSAKSAATVTHTLSPLHPYLTQRRARLRAQAQGDQGHRRRPGRKPASSPPRTASCRSRSTRPTGPAIPSTWRSSTPARPSTGSTSSCPRPAYPEKPLSFWTQGEAEETHHWLPCYDYPNDRATTEMIITVEKPLFVLSNGALVETKDNADNTTTYHWKMDVPHVSYLISLAASDFAVYHDRAGDLPVDYYVAKHVDEATARRFMGKTPQMIRFFGEKTGQPYPYAKYAQVCLPEFARRHGEHLRHDHDRRRALHDEIAGLEHDEDGLVAHELAHQWFGDLLTCKDWSHLWLNEGFASYFDPLFAEHDRGDDEFRLEMKGSLDSLPGRATRVTAGRSSRPDTKTSDDMFDGVTYSKGACVLHTLRGLLGDEAWWKGIRAYVAAHKFQVVETDDFRKAMEAASGKDLKWFFDQWVYKAGHPELKVRWHYEDADKTVRVRIQQTQKVDDQTPLFRLPTTLEITEDAGKTTSHPHRDRRRLT